MSGAMFNVLFERQTYSFALIFILCVLIYRAILLFNRPVFNSQILRSILNFLKESELPKKTLDFTCPYGSPLGPRPGVYCQVDSGTWTALAIGPDEVVPSCSKIAQGCR